MKTKLLSTFTLTLAMLFGLANQVIAVSPKVVITKLPEYININSFKLSYSAVADDPSSINVKFYYKVDDGAYTHFGGTLVGASGQVQVGSSQVGQSEKKYCFQAELVSGTFSNETCTTFDQNAPNAPNSFSKERINPTTYRLRWRTPNNSDFSRVFVYRSETSNFEADGTKKVAEVGGAPDTAVEWDDFGLDPNKTYYYVLRSIDKAGNSSGLVGDTSVVYEETEAAGTGGPISYDVTQFPTTESDSGEAEGEVLSDESVDESVQEVDDEKSALDKLVESATGERRNRNLMIVATLVVVAYLVYRKYGSKLTKSE